MDDRCGLDELELLDYLLGVATPALRARVEGAPACRAAATELGRLLAALYRSRCPEAPALVAYQEGRIGDSTLQLSIHRHVASCPACAEELALLAAIDAVPLGPRPVPPLRRVVEALLRPPLGRAVPLRGEQLLYETPAYTVHLRVRQSLDQPGAWTVRGQVRTADGRRAADRLRSAQAASPDGPAVAAAVEAEGIFHFAALTAGVWSLTVELADETVVIKAFAVGEPDGAAR